MEEPESKLDERGAAGGGNQPREGAPAEAEPSEQEGLNAEEAAEAQETVEEFMAVAAQQNVAAGEAVPERRNHPGPYIAFDHVSISFDELLVLDDVSFSVLPGETLCILGRSGVGKSVALKILMGFLKPDTGRVLVAGEDKAEAVRAVFREEYDPKKYPAQIASHHGRGVIWFLDEAAARMME